MNKEYKGYNGKMIITDRGVIMKKGLSGGFYRGDKTIPFKSIIAVELRKANLMAGYIQLTLRGGSEAKGGVFQAGFDENSIAFHDWFLGKKNAAFEEARNIIEEHIHKSY